MKKMIVTAALIAAGAAQAAGLSWQELAQGHVNQHFDPSPDVGLVGPAKGSKISLGQLVALSPGEITFTYLGQESGFSDGLKLLVGPGLKITETTVGDSVSATIGAGVVDFKFFDSNGKKAFNGPTSGWDKYTSIGLIDTDFVVGKLPKKYKGDLSIGDKFDFVIAFNDSGAGHDDWDDYVVGVNMAPIPEPGTWALMAAGLGVLGFVARRRQARA